MYERLFKCLIVLILLLFPLYAFARNIDPGNDGSQYAWGENVGWINFEPSRGPGVTVANTGLSGYAWGENIGWINLSPSAGGVVNDGIGNLSGYAWGENVGWINFSGVFIHPSTGLFHGYAWGENIGWINFAPNGKGIKASWTSPNACSDNDHDGYAVQGGSCGPADCNDSNALEHPNQIWYQDTDGDGYSNGTISVQCSRPAGYRIASELIATGGDCDNTDSNEHPNQTWFKDEDNDGYSDGTQNTSSCTRPVNYKIETELTAITGDCNDKNPSMNPGTGICDSVDPDNNNAQYAWGENVGWINFEPSRGPGVTVTNSAMTGYAWGENIGWINLSPSSGGVVNDGSGNLSGYAWGENTGWINFNGVKINPSTGVFSGYAWGENIGWVNLAPNGKPVKTLWRGAVDNCPDDPNKTEPGICGCGIPDTDADVDGTPDCHDNCPTMTNPDQRDSDGDGIGDVCDLMKLLVPNGGDVIPSGGTYAICWQAPSSIQKFDLKYSIDNGTNWTLIKSVTGLSCLSWAVPTVSQNEKDCLVKVIGYNAGGAKITEDTSDKPFTIEVVRVLSPNGGETLTSGRTWTIRWQTNKTINPVAKTVLQYTTNGTTWNAIKTLTGNPGSYNWTVPSVSSTKCKVKVILKDAGGTKVGTDVSNKVFTIQP